MRQPSEKWLESDLITDYATLTEAGASPIVQSQWTLQSNQAESRFDNLLWRFARHETAGPALLTSSRDHKQIDRMFEEPTF